MSVKHLNYRFSIDPVTGAFRVQPEVKPLMEIDTEPITFFQQAHCPASATPIPPPPQQPPPPLPPVSTPPPSPTSATLARALTANRNLYRQHKASQQQAYRLRRELDACKRDLCRREEEASDLHAMIRNLNEVAVSRLMEIRDLRSALAIAEQVPPPPPAIAADGACSSSRSTIYHEPNTPHPNNNNEKD